MKAKSLSPTSARKLHLAWMDGIETLYKFRSFAGLSRNWVKDILKNSRVYFSRPDQFNDPFDIAPIVRHSGDPNDPSYVAALAGHQEKIAATSGKSPAQLARLPKATVHDLPRLAEEDLRRSLREQTRVFCLTANQLHPLQWSHYADSHRGLCLHFRCRPGTPFGLARKVHYRKVRKPILISPKPMNGWVMTQRLVFVKAQFWGYEHEYRIISAANAPTMASTDKRGYLAFDRTLLTGVTLGMQMPSGDRAAVARMVQRYRPGLPIFEAVASPNEFAIRVHPYVVPATARGRRLGAARKK